MSEATPVPNAAGPAPATAPSPIQTEVGALLGPEAVFEAAGRLPAFRVPAGQAHEACRKLLQAGFEHLLFVTAVDYPEANRLEVVYALGNFVDARELCLVADVPRDHPRIPTVTDLWAGADWHEREVYDLFGVHFENHPDLRRILLEDDWEGYPLRKDYVDTTHDVVKRGS